MFILQRISATNRRRDQQIRPTIGHPNCRSGGWSIKRRARFQIANGL